ncbi:MAG: hypothetical protein SFV18_15475 [Bryobacteraceae bacterium]|nr:hypothetical protein [Bryobacteraceae bacterium]
MPKKTVAPKSAETLTHDDKRTLISTAESVRDARRGQGARTRRVRKAERRSRPQLVWRGKYDSDTLEIQAHPLYIQEKVHHKALIDDLRKAPDQISLFADFNGLPEGADKTEFYQHEIELDEPDDPGRQPAGDGVAGGA